MSRAMQPALGYRGAAYSLLGILAALSVAPLLWVWLQSLRHPTATSTNPFGLEWPLRLDAYATAWEQARFSSYLVNSVVVAVAVVAIVLAVSVPAAYALSCLDLRLSQPIFIAFLLGLMLPIWSLIIPLFFQLRDLGMINTLWGAVLVEAAIGLPFAIFMLRSFMQQLPREILDAARIDGASHLRTIWSVVVPMSLPALQALTVFQFMWSWNELVVPLFLLQSDAVRTLPIGLTFFQGRFTTDTGVLAAGTTIASLPVLLVYLFLNRHFIRGLTAGSTK